jgi:DNA-binding LacI/PurR family transcriptional regulator
MKITLKDVAALAGVSPATASLALNDKYGVNKETKLKVLDAAKKLDYVQSSVGLNLTTGKSNTIGFYIINSGDNPDLTGECSYFYPMIRGILSLTTERHYSFNFTVKYWDEIKNTNYIVKKSRDQSNDGMIIVPQYDYPCDFIYALEEKGFPYVLINPKTIINESKKVSLDNYFGARIATEYLIKLGYKKIGYINGPQNHYDAILRKEGFIEAMMKANCNISSSYIFNGDFTTKSGFEIMNKMIDDGNIPQALFCANDYMAAGAIQALSNRGYRIPNDISIIGFDDTDVAASVFPVLTSIVNPTYKLGRIAVQRLFDIIDGKEDLEEIIIKPYLKIRNSCKTAEE